jgi:transposase
VRRARKDFGISETTVQNWVSRAEIDDGKKPGVTSSEAAELREGSGNESDAWSRKTRSCAGLPHICLRGRSQTDLPARSR